MDKQSLREQQEWDQMCAPILNLQVPFWAAMVARMQEVGFSREEAISILQVWIGNLGRSAGSE